jgi:hypothetical protein
MHLLLEILSGFRYFQSMRYKPVDGKINAAKEPEGLIPLIKYIATEIKP